MSKPPAEFHIGFRLSGEPARHFAAMMESARAQSPSIFAKAMLLDLIADDQAAHEVPTPSLVHPEPYSWDDVKAAPVVRTIVNGVERSRGQS